MPAKKKRPVRARASRVLRGAALKQQAGVALERLLAEYPDAHCALDFTNAYQLLVATILSTQDTDKLGNMVTHPLSARYWNTVALEEAGLWELEEHMRSR